MAIEVSGQPASEPFGPCVWCGRPSWLLDPATAAHPCYSDEIGRRGHPRREPCEISAAARRRWEQAHPPEPA